MAKKVNDIYIDTIEEIIENLGYKLVEYHLIYQGKSVRAVIDIHKSYGYISHKDCENVSKNCEDFLIEKFGDDITLEVSSPGINRILKTDRELKVFIGYEIELYFKKDLKKQLRNSGKLHLIKDGNAYILKNYKNNELFIIPINKDMAKSLSVCSGQANEQKEEEYLLKISKNEISKIKLLN